MIRIQKERKDFSGGNPNITMLTGKEENYSSKKFLKHFRRYGMGITAINKETNRNRVREHQLLSKYFIYVVRMTNNFMVGEVSGTFTND